MVVQYESSEQGGLEVDIVVNVLRKNKQLGDREGDLKNFEFLEVKEF